MVHSPRVPDRGACTTVSRTCQATSPLPPPSPHPLPFCINIENILISKATFSTTTWPIFSSVLKSRASPNPNLPEGPACSDLLTGGDWEVGMTGVLWRRVRSHRSLLFSLREASGNHHLGSSISQVPTVLIHSSVVAKQSNEELEAWSSHPRHNNS